MVGVFRRYLRHVSVHPLLQYITKLGRISVAPHRTAPLVQPLLRPSTTVLNYISQLRHSTAAFTTALKHATVAADCSTQLHHSTLARSYRPQTPAVNYSNHFTQRQHSSTAFDYSSSVQNSTSPPGRRRVLPLAAPHRPEDSARPRPAAPSPQAAGAWCRSRGCGIF